MGTPFPLGKLPYDHLERLLSFSIGDPRVVLGPKVGEDAAVIDVGDRYLIAKSDPITFASDAIGWYAVHVNANDVACMGATSRWFLATLLLPGGRADTSLVEQIVEQIQGACRELDVTLVGGHTEITYDLDRPILVGVMLGEVAPERLVTTGGAQVDDAVVLTKRMAVEATAIIAREKWDDLARQHGLSSDFLDRCADFLYRPGISVVREARVATQAAPIHAMHDPTEGGLATGLWELAHASDLGLEIEAQEVPLYPETRLLCEAYDLDPWGVIGSGSLLLTMDVGDADRVCRALSKADIESSVIGRMVPRERGLLVRSAEGQVHELPTFARDEIARLFE